MVNRTAAFLVLFLLVASGCTDQPSTIGKPTTPSPESSIVPESPEPLDSNRAFSEKLEPLLSRVPGWATSNGPTPTIASDYAFNGKCSGNWSQGATGGGDGGLGGTRAIGGIAHAGFESDALASDAAARFVENLESCTATAWRTRPIAQRPGAVLASASDAVAWIQQMRTDVFVLQVGTADGPPPIGVQVEVAEWMVAYIAWQNGWPEP